MLKIYVIGSSSEGNCYAIETANSILVIEAGIKFLELKKAINFNISKVVGVLVSHSHKDHSKYANEYLKNGINVYCSPETAAESNITEHYFCEKVKNKEFFRINDFLILPFDVKHDVTCYGFIINHKEFGNLLFATDTYYLKYTFKDLNYVMIEANYDEDILKQNIDSGMNEVYASRIYKSHMSIQTCIQALKANDLSECKGIVLLHLSNGNSNAEQFKTRVQSETGIMTYIADKKQIIEII